LAELQIFHEADWVEPQNRFVFWSGGKDSTVALHLALRAWDSNPPKVVFVDTGITLPETLAYVEKISADWNLNLVTLKPRIDFWAYVEKNGFPFFHRLWCRRLLKMTPIRRFLNRLPGWKVNVLGIRRRESTQRMKSKFYDKPFRRHTKLKHTYILLPVLDWSEEQVNAYLKQNNIPVNPCYEYFGTSGCYFCPFVTNPRHYLALKKRHPRLFDKLLQAEKKIRSNWKVFGAGKPTVAEINEQRFLEV
jgi:3'-phosphoadenosine 5'-phosphosulfate sulfotransferase (PAPS reductase)/FAD synthetase